MCICMDVRVQTAFGWLPAAPISVADLPLHHKTGFRISVFWAILVFYNPLTSNNSPFSNWIPHATTPVTSQFRVI